MIFVLALSMIDHQYITQPSLALQQRDVYVNSMVVLDRFEGFGSVIEHHLTSYDDVPCTILKQYTALKSKYYIDLIPEYSASSFSQHFIDGQFTEIIPQLLISVNVGVGAVVLTSLGELIYIIVENQNQVIRSRHQLDLSQRLLEQPIFLEYVNECLVVVVDGYTGLIQLDFDHTDIFHNSMVRMVYSFSTELIRRVTAVNGCLYLAVKNQGLFIFKVANMDLFVQFNVAYTTIQDISVQFTKDMHTIYILDQESGIVAFNYNSTSGFLEQNSKLGIIDVSGSMIGAYGNTVLVLRQKFLRTFEVIDIHVDLEQNTWYELNQYAFQGQAVDLDVSDGFAIILGKHGHYIYYHSISQYFYSTTEQQSHHQPLNIPGLRSLSIYHESDGSRLAHVITSHRFFTWSIKINPPLMYCYIPSSTKQNSISFTYHLKSTQCANKLDQLDDLTACQYQQDYTVLIRRPIITTDSQTLVVSIVGVVLLLFIIVGLAILLKYRQFTQIKHEIMLMSLEDDSGANKSSDVPQTAFTPNAIANNRLYMAVDVTPVDAITPVNRDIE